eukprot:GFUD01038878.1.p1 GENE.GFUD01038878.1~~GFUD01038878.1.p1  ORF type:complete len:1043 (+),score=277.73 GFUD01038878.1:105-3233(+)
MGSVWKRLNRINKRASKFHFTASYSELWLEAGPNWQPTALSVIWTRKSRRVVSDPVKWEPTMKSPYIGMCVWPVPENKDITVTMFRDPNKEEYENKDWFFILEDVNAAGKRKPVAQGRLNMKEFSTAIPTQHNLTVKLRPISKKVSSAKLTLTLTAELIREGKATDEDMRSIASLVSNSTMSDYGNSLIKEVDEELSTDETNHVIKDEIANITKQMESMNNKGWDSASQEVLPVRTLVEKPAAQYPEKTRVGKPLRDENENKARPVVSANVTESNHKIKQVDILPKVEPKSRGFGSREFKSTYNGPMGDYTNGPVRKTTPPRGNLEQEADSTDDTSSLLGNSSKSSIKSPQVVSTANRAEKKIPISPLARKPVDEVKPVFKKEDLPLLPLRNIKTPEKIVVSATVEAVPVEKEPIIVEGVKMRQKETVLTHEKPKDVVATEEKTPEKATTPVKYQRTKSQEFRDYQQEFVLTSTIDFGPLQPVAPNLNIQPTATATSTPVPTKLASSQITNSPSPIKMPTPSPPKANSTPESEDNNPFYKSSPEKPCNNPFDQASPEKPFSLKVLPMPKPEAEPEPEIKPFMTPSPEKSEPVFKTEITPSQSFLNNLNRSSYAPETETENSSSDTTPVTEKSQIPSDPRMEKILADRTNSLLRKNPAKTSNDLLDWSKSICSSYSNIKVTNFTTSWRNGMAFCALIHSFYPDLIPYDTLTAHDVKHNCKLAFEAGEKLGIPRVIEPESMVIKRIPDKLAVITYLHQLRSSLGQEETRLLYEKSKEEQQVPNTGVRKSFSEGNIRLFSRSSSNDTDRSVSDLPTIEESPNIDIRPEKISEYRKRAKTLVEQARSESKDSDYIPDLEPTNGNSSPPKVIMRQKSTTPKPKKDNRLSYIDNEIKVLDAEQIEIDKQAAILDKRLRETSEDDELVYDALLQQWFTLVNKKNALLRRQMQLNILEKEDDLEKKLLMLQEELRSLSEMEDSRKTEDDMKRENLLLEELVLVVNQRNELVIQRDEEERMIEQDEQLDEEVTLPENEHLRNNKKDDCRMQ